jgi:exopolyphosphatase/guanosine-5'-triphosphate,3'-diphosphate pyrophosphatase
MSSHSLRASIAAQSPNTLAAVDIGSNAIRLAVAQVLPSGEVEMLEHLQRGVRLGHDTFRRGKLSPESLRSAVNILRDFRRVLELYQARRVRAVATSAVREATNADAFLDRVSMATGLHVEIIGTAEESRLMVSAVCHSLGETFFQHGERLLVAEVGGGSTLLTVLQGRTVQNFRSARLGSIRMQELLGVSEEPSMHTAALLRRYIAKVVAALEGTLDFTGIRKMIALGADARFAAREVGSPTEFGQLYCVPAEGLGRLVEKCQSLSIEQLSREYALPLAEAETIVPALLVYQQLLNRVRCPEIFVSFVSMRDGLILDLARELLGKEDPSLAEGVLRAAEAIALRYGADLQHARIVRSLCVRIFTELQSEHRLGYRDRLLLEVAALLHEIGGFVSSQAHHKHSFYLISNTEIFGLNRLETQIVAHVARYHRRSGPKPSHLEYMSLPESARMTVNKLAAILRIADALSRVQLPRETQLGIKRVRDELVITVPSPVDRLLERQAMAFKAGLFEEIFGLRIRLEEA